LYATQNRSELKKLGLVPQAKARMRYLLLLDFQRNMDTLRRQTTVAGRLPAIRSRRGGAGRVCRRVIQAAA
jgi:hypothetical protein